MMANRTLVLAIPSAIILIALVAHSLRTLPRRRAVTFWIAVVVYGFLRGIAVHRITESIGASFPYQIHNAMLTVAGVSLQEIVGWAVVAYLGWWIGGRFASRSGRPFLFLQIAWASLFLGAISWTVEAAAIAARWWHWTVPTASRMFLNTPAIGIVDWFFVGIDFLLPFVAITAPALRRRPSRFLTLLLFPLHFGAHLLIAPVSASWPVAWLHVVHWLLVLLVLWLAVRSPAEDPAFATEASATVRAIPTIALAVIVADVAIVELFIVRRPELLQSVGPVIAVWLAALSPVAAMVTGAAALLATIRLPSLIVTTAVVLTALALLFVRRSRSALMAPALIAAVAAGAFLFHARMAAEREEMTRRLDRALAERNGGNLEGALEQFAAIERDHPAAYAASAFAGEIFYRTRRLDEAAPKFERAITIKQDFLRGYRLLAAIELQRRRPERASHWAREGLEVAPSDLQLRYLAARADRTSTDSVIQALDSPATASGMAALAFEVDDADTANAIVAASLKRWPDDAQLLALQQRLQTIP